MPTAIIVENAEFGQDNAGQFVQYNISITDNGEEINNVQRRYRDFKNFDGSWRKLYPGLECPLPRSVIFGANSPQVVGERIVGLTNYLRILAEIRSVQPLLSAFLQVKPNYFLDMVPKFQQPAPTPAPAGPPRPRPAKKENAGANNGGGNSSPTPQSGPAGPGPAGPKPGSRPGERTPPNSSPMMQKGPSPAPMMNKSMACFNCGVDNNGAPFCANCGVAQPKPEPEPEPVFDPSEPHVCGRCGVEGTGNFCNSCGFKLSPDQQSNNSSPSSSRSSSSSLSLSASSQSSAGSAGSGGFNGSGPAGSPPRGPAAGAPLPGFGNIGLGGPRGGRGGPVGGSRGPTPAGGRGGPRGGAVGGRGGPVGGARGPVGGRGGPIGGARGGPVGGPRGGRVGGGGAPPPVARKPTRIRGGSTPAPRNNFGPNGPFGGARDRGASSPAAFSENSYSAFPSAAPSEFGGDGNNGELSPPPQEFIGDIYEGRKLRRRKSFFKAATKDHWKVQSMSMVSRLLDKNRDDYCIFSDTALVYDPTFKSTKRILMMTDKALYLLSPGTLTAKWRINIRDIGAVSLSTQADHFIVIHPSQNRQADQMILCPRKTELLVALRYVMAVQFNIGLEMTFSDDISVQLKPPVRSVVTFREKQSFGDESVNLQVMDRGASGATITVSVPQNLLADPYQDGAEQERIIQEAEAQLYG